MARKSKQLEFLGAGFNKPKSCFGGRLLTSNPKVRRPLDSKLPIHLCLRANQGGLRLPKVFGQVNTAVNLIAKKYGVRIYEYTNVGNHLHVLIRVPNLRLWAAFIRELTGRVAQLAMELGVAVKGDGFWNGRPFTRIVSGWKKAFQVIKDYLYLNQLEADGFISRKETKTLKDYRAIFDG